VIGAAFRDILASAQAGDDAAFTSLFRDVQPALLRYLRLIAPDAEQDAIARRLYGHPLAWAVTMMTLGTVFLLHTLFGVQLPVREFLPVLLVLLGARLFPFLEGSVASSLAALLAAAIYLRGRVPLLPRVDLERWRRSGEPRSMVVVGSCIVPEDMPAEVAGGAFYSLIVIGSFISDREVLTALGSRLKIIGSAVARAP